MGAIRCQMEYFLKNGFLIFTVLLGAARSQECSIERARSALTNRTAQYESAIANLKNETHFKHLCLTQIRVDSTETNYDDALKLCTSAEVDIIQQNWFRLNTNITILCEQDCPSIRDLPLCKNMTYLDEIEFSRYETFCESFQTSLKCSKNALTGCKFGPSLYADILEPKVMLYWKYICNSGCSNIDETVAVITNCLDPLKSVDNSQICMAHYTFKQCIQEAKNVCREVLKLVRFIYRKYDAVDKFCTTTTTVTTTPLPVTTTLPVATEIEEALLEMTTESSLQTTTPLGPDETTTLVVKKDSGILTISDCLSDEDLQVISAAKINVDGVLVFLKLESCLHNNTEDLASLKLILDTFPEEIRHFHSRIRSEAWHIANQMLQDGSRCPQKQEELTNGCSGHEYGLIPCNTGRSTIYGTTLLISAFMCMKFVSIT